MTLTSSAGGLNLVDSSEPYETDFITPSGVTRLTFNGLTQDIAGNTTACAPVSVNVVPDPLTTVVGRVLDGQSAPLPGATVSVLDRSAQTGADGRFSIPSVPTVRGNLIVSTTFTRPDGTVLRGSSAPAAPVRGGTTDAGDILALEAAFENDIGTLALRDDDGSVTRTLPFSFAFGPNSYSAVHVSNNGNLTFGFDDGDYTETAAELLGEQPRIAALWDDLVEDVTFGDEASGLYINDQLPGRFVVTWLRQLEFDQVQGPNTVQLILFSDGRIQFAYRGVATLDGIVRISPVPSAEPPAGDFASTTSTLSGAVDFGANPTFSTGAGEAVYEQFEVPAPRGETDPEGSGLNPDRDRPFDLDNGFVLFTPNAAGGYDVRTIVTPAPPTLGAVGGMVMDAGGQPLQRAEVEVVSSLSPTFRAVTNTDAHGRYYCPRLPAGGVVRVKATRRGRRVGQGAGSLNAGGGMVVVDVHPARAPLPKGSRRAPR